MAALPHPFLVQPWHKSPQLAAIVAGSPLVWMEADVLEMWRDAYTLMLALEANGIKDWPGYKRALTQVEPTASTSYE